MKKLILLFVLVAILFSCKDKLVPTIKKQEIKVEKKQNFDWLIGNWKRTNDEEGKKTYENWHKKSNSEYIGLGFTMKGNDTISSESIQLIEKKANWEVIVSTVGKGDDTSATTFKMINKSNASFSCENNKIDFPNTIHYKRFGNTMKAVVANSKMSIPFNFELIKD